jgi:hypothetical protein
LANEAQAEALELRGSYTAVTERPAKVWPLQQVALLITNDEDGWETIAEVGNLTRTTQRIATGVHRLHYRRAAEFPPINVEGLIDAVPKKLRTTVEGRASAGGSLTEKAAAAVVAALAQLDPNAATAVRALRGQLQTTATRLRGDGLQAAAQEADAVRLALDIAGLDRGELGSARPDGFSSFVEVLGTTRAPEDTTIAYDSMRFLDFDRLDHPSGIVRFSKGEERLTVINVNRQPLERTTGADLIYINDNAASFVLVQYKTFRREGKDADVRQRLVFRPHGQFDDELARMRKLKPGKRDATDAGFRLHGGCCYLKFCKPVVTLDYDPRQLVGGMYLPIEYYDLLAAGGTIRGPKGGIALTYENVPRHLTNDLFVNLVRGGWIGSFGATSQKLTKIVLAGLDDGRSVTVASASRDVEPDE